MNVSLFGFNRGLVSSTALARVDLERMRLSAETQTNWLPRALGAMSLRPGLRYVLSTKSDAKAKYIPFIYSTTQLALLECTASYLRPIISEAPITRASVSTAISNGDFGSGTNWTIAGVGGGSAAISGGKLTFQNYSIDSYTTVTQTVTVAGGDQNVEHALRIIVDRGPVILRVGSTSGGDDYISTTSIGTGAHSLAFTPTGANVYVQFEGRERRDLIVDSCTVEAAGEVTLPGFWDIDDLPFLRWAQSGDVVFLACYGNQPRRIERRATNSWSIVLFEPTDGPFGGSVPDDNIKLAVNAGYGSATVTATRPFFKSTNVGSLLRIFTPGYDHYFNLAQNQAFTPVVRVNGVGTARAVAITTLGTWVGTLVVQVSYIDETSGFTSTGTTITTNTTTTYTNASDNSVVYVRVGFTTGYTSGTVAVQCSFGASGSGGGGGLSATSSAVTSVGGRFGILRITGVASSTSVTAEVLSPPSSSVQTNTWFEGEWSDRRGWPSAVDFHEGRLFWGGGDRIWGSISDAYSSYDPSQSGDSGPIQRSIGRGPVQLINWLLPLSRLIVGAEASEVSVRSSSFDEPITPTNFTLKAASTYGSARLSACQIDNRGVFIDKSGQNLMDIAYSVETQDYTTSNLLQLAPDLNLDNPVACIAVQRTPDTRVHMAREDGTVVVYLFEPKEEVRCPIIFETDGVVEDIVVLPGSIEDSVYYVVKRTINGSTKRYLECFARTDECIGGTLNKQADSYKLYSGASVTTITGLSHLEGKSVVVWGGGRDLGVYTVASGQITGLTTAVTSAVVGLPYTATFKSTKLAYAAQGGTAVNQQKRVNAIGLTLYKTHYQGLYHGANFDRMDNLPLVVDGVEIAADTIHDALDLGMTETPADWGTDGRLCIKAVAPRPCTVLGVVIQMETNG